MLLFGPKLGLWQTALSKDLLSFTYFSQYSVIGSRCYMTNAKHHSISFLLHMEYCWSNNLIVELEIDSNLLKTVRFKYEPYFIIPLSRYMTSLSQNEASLNSMPSKLWGLVCAPRFPSGISRNHSDSDRNPSGNFGTQYHPNSREFVKSVRPDSDQKGQFRSDHSELFPTSFRSEPTGSNRFQPVPIGKTVRRVINHQY